MTTIVLSSSSSPTTPDVDVDVLESAKKVTLRLGDVIQLITTSETPKNTYVIEYIDPVKIRLVNLTTFESSVLRIDPDTHVIGDGDIQKIVILSSHPQAGFARQNGLLPGKWITLYFGGDVPETITGKITNLADGEDMIEIRTINPNTGKLDDAADPIYIDFQFQGIPENLPIERIMLRDAAPRQAEVPEPGREGEEEVVVVQEGEEGDFAASPFGDEEEEEAAAAAAAAASATTAADEQPRVSPQARQQMILNISDIQFGDTMRVEETVTVDKSRFRFPLEDQTNDLLNEMLAEIAPDRRNYWVLDRIHATINRFVQLRRQASVLDANQNVVRAIQRTDKDKPLADFIASFRNQLYWILCVATQVKKVYTTKSSTTTAQNVVPALLEDVGAGSTDVGAGDADVDIGSNDVHSFNMRENLNDMATLFEIYLSTSTQDSATIYEKYQALYDTLVNVYMTPYEVPRAGSVLAARVLAKGNVKTPMTTVVDTLGECKSSVFTKMQGRSRSGGIQPRRFVLQKYNLGMTWLRADNLHGARFLTHRVNLTEPEVVSIRSILTLPEPAVRFSRVNLPNTDVMCRADLSQHFLNYWQMLKQATRPTLVTVGNLNAPQSLEYSENGFVNDMKHFVLGDEAMASLPRNGDGDGNSFRRFLGKIVPNFHILFTSMKKFMYDRQLSFLDAVQQLEPYQIYTQNITLRQFEAVRKFIGWRVHQQTLNRESRRKEFVKLNQTSQTRSRQMQQPQQQSSSGSGSGTVYEYSSPFFQLLNKSIRSGLGADGNDNALETEVMQLYAPNSNGQSPYRMILSPSEFLKHIIVSDFGHVFQTAVAIDTLSLVVTRDLQSLLETDRNTAGKATTAAAASTKDDSSCKTYTIAKKYRSLDDLAADNGKVIYYDREWDQTPYEALEERYGALRRQFADQPEQLVIHVANNLKRRQKELSDRDADVLAEAFLNGVKKVSEGEYALLLESPAAEESVGDVLLPTALVFYVRKDDMWAEDKTVNPEWFIEQKDILCNLNYSCLFDTREKQASKQCKTNDAMRDQVVERSIQQVLDQFDDKMAASHAELEERERQQYAYFKDMFPRWQKLHADRRLQYNNEKAEIGLEWSKTTEAMTLSSAKQIVSPYAELRDLILGQSDFAKKQTDIVRFVEAFCRAANPELPDLIYQASIAGAGAGASSDVTMENSAWLYCRKTNVRLLPTFRFQLASAFVTDPGSYDRVLSRIIQTVGKIEGDAWVDENSGEIIAFREFDTSSGVGGGFGGGGEDGDEDEEGGDYGGGGEGDDDEGEGGILGRGMLGRSGDTGGSDGNDNDEDDKEDEGRGDGGSGGGDGDDDDDDLGGLASSVSRALLEQGSNADVQSSSSSAATRKRIELSPQGRMVSNVINAISDNMGIRLGDSVHDWIVSVVTGLMGNTKVMPTPEMYDRQQQAKASRDPKATPPYKQLYHSTLLYLTLGMFFIGVQTSIPPPMHTKKALVVGECVRSFSGFPIDGDSDLSGITYLACVTARLRNSSTEPWSAIPKDDKKKNINATDKIVERTIWIMRKYLLGLEPVKRALQAKLEYLLASPEMPVPEEHAVERWVQFRPPLRRFTVSAHAAEPLSDAFMETLMTDMRAARSRQGEKLRVVQSKMYAAALAMLESIQDVVDKKTLLLHTSGGRPYMDNACCNESDRRGQTALGYFIAEDSSIEQRNQQSAILGANLRDVRLFSEATLFLSIVDTKRGRDRGRDHPPAGGVEFSEETIYLGFIAFCKFQSTLPIDVKLAQVCMEKPEPLLRRTDVLQDRISRLKREGKQFSRDQFLRLFQIVSQQNVIPVSIVTRIPSCAQALKRTLEALTHDNVPATLFQHLETLLQNFEDKAAAAGREKVMTEEAKNDALHDIESFVMKSVSFMRDKVLAFVKKHVYNDNRFSRWFSKMTEELTELTVWKTDSVAGNNDGLYNKLQFMRNFINLFSAVYPSIIRNRKEQTIVVPYAWNLSESHRKKIAEMARNVYGDLMPFFANQSNQLVNLLATMQHCSTARQLAAVTPALSAILAEDGQKMYTVFEPSLVTALYEYYLLVVLYGYVQLTDDPDLLLEDDDITRRMVTNEDYCHDYDMLMDNMELKKKKKKNTPSSTNAEMAMRQNVVATALKMQVANLLVVYLKQMMQLKKTLNVTVADVKGKIFQLKEAEKQGFRENLRNLSSAAREVDVAYRTTGQGRYNVGKLVRHYNRDVYELDRRVAEENARRIKKHMREHGLSMMEDVDMDAIGGLQTGNEPYQPTHNVENLGEDGDGDGREEGIDIDVGGDFGEWENTYTENTADDEDGDDVDGDDE